jgi:hypothetical protein
MSRDALILWIGVSHALGFFLGYMYCLSHDKKGLPKPGDDKK